MAPLELDVVAVTVPEGTNVVIGQAHFVKTVEDIHEALVGSVPQLRFAVAFCEASGPASSGDRATTPTWRWP